MIMNDSFAMTQEQILALEIAIDNTQWGPIIFSVDSNQREDFVGKYNIKHSKIPHKIDHLNALLKELPEVDSHGCVIELPFWRDNKDEEFLEKANQIINHFSPIGFKRIHYKDNPYGFPRNPGEPNGGYWMESHDEETYIVRSNGNAERVTDHYPKKFVEDRLKDGLWVEF